MPWTTQRNCNTKQSVKYDRQCRPYHSNSEIDRRFAGALVTDDARSGYDNTCRLVSPAWHVLGKLCFALYPA